MGIYAVKPAFQRTLTPVKNWLVKNRVHPTTINITGFLASLALAGCLILSSEIPLMLFLVPVFAFIRTALNALDGLVSRELKLASAFGEVLNEFIDRISDVIIFLSLAVLPEVQFFLVFLTIVIILLNSYLSILSKAAGASRQYGGLMGKADRMIVISIAAVLAYFLEPETDVWNYFLIVVFLCTCITLCQRFAATKRELTSHAS